MKTKEEIVANWLPRYTKRKLEDFGEYILLTNFNKYVEIFAERFNVPILGRDANMISAHAEGMTIINFGMGSPNAAIIMDLLSAVSGQVWRYRQEEPDRRPDSAYRGHSWRRNIERLLSARGTGSSGLYAPACRIFGHP